MDKVAIDRIIIGKRGQFGEECDQKEKSENDRAYLDPIMNTQVSQMRL